MKKSKNTPKIHGQSPALCEDVHNANLLRLSYGKYMEMKREHGRSIMERRAAIYGAVSGRK